MFALVDVNNMYVSCERVFNPSLNGRPVVVLANNDGACIARSNESKDLGIKMAEPWFKVRHLEKTAGLIALSANFELYGDMSSRMMAIVGRYAPRQEVYSIDESFLDFSGVPGDLVSVGKDMRARVLQWTGLPTSVGFGATKTLAKLANHIAKTADRKPGSYPAQLAQVCDLSRLTATQLRQVFSATEVGNVWGVGRKINERLQAAGIRSVQDLVNADAAVLRQQFSVVLEKTVLELRGVSCLAVDDEPAPQQQIMCSRSFAAPITDIAGLSEVVSQFATRVCEKLRQQQAVAGAVHVFFSTSPFREHDRQHNASATLPLARPSADTRAILGSALDTVRALFRPGVNYVKAGVMVTQLQPQGQQQAELDLFAEPQVSATSARESDALMQALDDLNRRFGKGMVGVASARHQGAGKPHAGRQDRRSPRYTTRLDEIPVVTAGVTVESI